MLLEITLIKFQKIININYRKKKTERLTAVSRNCGVWDLSEMVIFETKFCLYL